MDRVHNNSLMLRLLAGLAILVAFAGPAQAKSGGSNSGDAQKIEVVGHNDLGGRGFNGDVWVQGLCLRWPVGIRRLRCRIEGSLLPKRV